MLINDETEALLLSLLDEQCRYPASAATTAAASAAVAVLTVRRPDTRDCSKRLTPAGSLRSTCHLPEIGINHAQTLITNPVRKPSSLNLLACETQSKTQGAASPTNALPKLTPAPSDFVMAQSAAATPQPVSWTSSLQRNDGKLPGACPELALTLPQELTTTTTEGANPARVGANPVEDACVSAASHASAPPGDPPAFSRSSSPELVAQHDGRLGSVTAQSPSFVRSSDHERSGPDANAMRPPFPPQPATSSPPQPLQATDMLQVQPMQPRRTNSSSWLLDDGVPGNGMDSGDRAAELRPPSSRSSAETVVAAPHLSPRASNNSHGYTDVLPLNNALHDTSQRTAQLPPVRPGSGQPLLPSSHLQKQHPHAISPQHPQAGPGLLLQQQHRHQQQQHSHAQAVLVGGRAVRFSKDGDCKKPATSFASVPSSENLLPPLRRASDASFTHSGVGLPVPFLAQGQDQVAQRQDNPQPLGPDAAASTTAGQSSDARSTALAAGRPRRGASDDGGASCGRRSLNGGPKTGSRGTWVSPRSTAVGDAVEQGAVGASTALPGQVNVSRSGGFTMVQEDRVRSTQATGEDKISGSGGGCRRRSSGLSAGKQPSIHRAVELSPLGTSAGFDAELREALARAAVNNVAQLTAGGKLPDADFEFSRVLAQHQAQQRDHAALGDGCLATSQPAPSVEQPADMAMRASRDGEEQHTSAPPSPPNTIRPGRPPLGPVRSVRSALKNGGQSTNSLYLPPLHRSFSPANGLPPTSALPGDGPTRQEPGRLPLRRRSSFSSSNSTPAGFSTAAAATLASSDTHRRALRSAFPVLTTHNHQATSDTGGESALIDSASYWDHQARSGQDLRNAENVDIRIHCLTFNMGNAMPPAAALPESLFSGSYLSPDSVADAGAHIYVFATQESGPLGEWEAAVAAHLGRRYRRVAVESLMSIHILLYAVQWLADEIKEVRTSSVATGVGNVLGNKGGVAVTFSLLGAQVLLVGAHFAAHDANVERRNADFHRICAGLFAPPPPAPPPQPPVMASVNAQPAATTSTAATSAVPPAPGGGSSLPGGEGPAGGSVESCNGGESGEEGGGGVGQRNGGSRRHALGPTLSRFSRGANVVAFCTAAESEPKEPDTSSVASTGSDAGVPSSVPAARTLTRTLSASSVSSMNSTMSTAAASARHMLEGPSRLRLQSFWSGISFAAAQRHSSVLLEHFDVVLWMGDLNYRIAGNPEVVKYAIDHNMVEVLRANDQLQQQKKKGKVLQGFQEMPIAFAPTYKFNPGTDAYDLRRIPAWTDRVLYLTNADPLFADLRPLYYMSVPELRTSDHKPVIAGFELSICPQHAGNGRQARQRGCVIS